MRTEHHPITAAQRNVDAIMKNQLQVVSGINAEIA